MIDLAAVGRLFGVPTVLAAAHVDEVDEISTRLAGRLPTEATPLRHRTFAAGRLAAARALAQCTGTWIWLSADASGRPVWPRGFTGSLSHSDELAICVLGQSHVVGGLGIDLEPLSSAGGLLSAVTRICTARERERALTARAPAAAVLRVFCAKEALYKALPASRQAGMRFGSISLEWTEPSGRTATVDLHVAGARVAARVLGEHMVAAAVVPGAPPARE